MEMAEQIAQILGDENAMNKIKQLADGLSTNDISGLAGMLGGAASGQQASGSEIGSLVPLMLSAVGGGGGGKSGSDPNVELIRALKPFLSPKRKKRANQAVKIMKLLEMLPLLQQSGMLSNLMGGGDDD